MQSILSSQLPRLTVGLIAVSIIVALASRLGTSIDTLEPLFITFYYNQGLPEIRSGEVWRLITPIFIHFGIMHLAFNMLWLWDLGGSIERIKGWRLFIPLILVIGVPSNLAEYSYSGPGFGGMSGIVYGLLGYIWMQGHFNPRFGLYLHKPIVVMMLIWFVLCWTGLVGNIANMAHTVGLLIGVIWGFTAAKIAVYK